MPLFRFEQTDYIVIDRNRQHIDVFVLEAEEKLKGDLAKEYEIVFHREGIMIYRKNE